ncbi:hypothetical protein ACQP00_20400 [Dactylosporangium sp. CS-047395]|uniref:EamA family transporter n=1 Tax=Dactylosporangium sp. CS-047395 TaxID=3239936 RepID=UPI003D8F1816
MQRSSAVDAVWATALARTSSGMLGVSLLITAAVRYRRHDPSGPGAKKRADRPVVGAAAVAGIVAVGLTDTAGDAAFAIASTMGVLGSVAVLSSLYPAVTVLFGTWFLHERLTAPRRWGVLAALAGGAFLAV